MPRSYTVFLIALLASGGWFFTKGPGQGNLGKILSSYSPAQGGPAQAPPGYAPPGYAPGHSQPGYPQPGYAAPLAGQPTGAQIPAHYANQSAPAASAPAAPAPAAPAPMFGGPAIRIASFNIQVFGDSKASKPHIMWTLAAIIQQFHIVAIQEIRTKDEYFVDNFLRNYVNQNGRTYDKIVGPRLGRSNSKEQYAFVYDTAAIEVNPRSVYTMNDPDDLLHREPLVAMFRVRGPPPQQAFTFVLVNIHTDPDETDTELDALGQVYQAVRRASNGEDDIIVLGDLNVDDENLGLLGRLDGVRPVVRGVYTNTRQTKLYDNIVFHFPSTAEFSGRWGVVNIEQAFNLTRDQALQVSDHLPVWAEFSAYESSAPGRVAARDVSPARPQ